MISLSLSLPRVPWRPIAALVLVLAGAGAGWNAHTTHERLSARLEAAECRAGWLERRASRLRAQVISGALSRSLLEASLVEERRLRQESQAFVQPAEDAGVSFGHTPLPGPPVPRISGTVLATKLDVEPGLVLLDVGSDDAVEVGFHFSVYRGNNFQGKVVVERVLNDCAGCRILFLAEGASIGLGDSAATRLQ